MSEMDFSDEVRLYYDWNDVDDTSFISIGDVVFAGDGDGGMKVRVTGFDLLKDTVLIRFERLEDSGWISLENSHRS